MSQILALQMQFSQDAARLILKAAELGYGVTLGEAWRTPEQVLYNVAHGLGTSTSLHPSRLAIDLNLFHNDVIITEETGHRDLGAWWKTLSPRHRWGGDFQKLKDFDHYSISPDGVRA